LRTTADLSEKEDVMIEAIGDAAMQQTIRASYNNGNQEQAAIEDKNDQVRVNRTIENSDDSAKSQMDTQNQEDTRAKTTFEDGQIIVEKYDQDGRLVRKIPPGYLPLNESV
jgi:hypothetical protein